MDGQSINVWTGRASTVAFGSACRLGVGPYTPAVLRRRIVPTLAALALLPGALMAACTGGPATTPPVTPGTSASPRNVNVVARDYTFSPPVVDVVPGETVALHLINGGLEPHEVIIGDQGVQDAWEIAEADLAPTRPGVTAAVSVPPGLSGLRFVVRSGERVDVTWTVPLDPSIVTGLILGCHIAGHYAKGMHVPLRIVTRGA